MYRVTLPKRLNHNARTYSWLARTYADVQRSRASELQLVGANTEFFAGDMSPVLDGVLHRLSLETHTTWSGLSTPVSTVLRKNGFLERFGWRAARDTYGTTLKHARFSLEDGTAYRSYVERELLGRPELPDMAPAVEERLLRALFEISENAETHSGTEHYFSGGQLFPNRHRLAYTFVDIGLGIKHVVSQFFERDVPALTALTWALRQATTTKRGPIPGGIGLHDIRQFLEINRGRLLIVSDRAYWSKSRTGLRMRRLTHPFPGTVVHMSVNTADSSEYYAMTDESVENLF